MLGFNNTNNLVKNAQWDIKLSKTGYIREAGKCLVMLATIASKPFVIVLLDSAGKYTRLGDAQRVRHWLETGETLPADRRDQAAAEGAKRRRRRPRAYVRRRRQRSAAVASRAPELRQAAAAVPQEELLRVRPRLRGDLAAGEHPRELLDPLPCLKAPRRPPARRRRRPP